MHYFDHTTDNRIQYLYFMRSLLLLKLPILAKSWCASLLPTTSMWRCCWGQRTVPKWRLSGWMVVAVMLLWTIDQCFMPWDKWWVGLWHRRHIEVPIGTVENKQWYRSLMLMHSTVHVPGYRCTCTVKEFFFFFSRKTKKILLPTHVPFFTYV